MQGIRAVFEGMKSECLSPFQETCAEERRKLCNKKLKEARKKMVALLDTEKRFIVFPNFPGLRNSKAKIMKPKTGKIQRVQS